MIFFSFLILKHRKNIWPQTRFESVTLVYRTDILTTELTVHV